MELWIGAVGICNIRSSLENAPLSPRVSVAQQVRLGYLSEAHAPTPHPLRCVNDINVNQTGSEHLPNSVSVNLSVVSVLSVPALFL